MTKAIKGLSIVSILAAGLSLGSAALAQDSGCACLAPAPNGGAVGEVVSVAGEVLSSQTDGLQPAAPGSSLLVGSQLLTGPGSSAQLAVGSCALAVAPNSEVTIERIGENICVRLNQVGAPQTGQIGSAVNLPLLLFGGTVAAGAATGAALGGGDDGASP